MASTFSELYSDFQDNIKAYTEALDITELAFMRMLTRGMQVFQRDTELLEAYKRIDRAATAPFFTVPEDMLRPIMFMDSTGKEIVPNGLTQAQRNVEVSSEMKSRVPRVHDYLTSTTASIVTLHNNVLNIIPDIGNSYVDLFYIPDIHAISRTSFQWAAWFPHETNFMTLFSSARIVPGLAPYEQAFVDYATSRYIASKKSADYVVYENRFKSEIKNAIANKWAMNTQMARDYFMAPFS